MTAPVSVSCSKQTKSLTQTGLRSISGIGTDRRASRQLTDADEKPISRYQSGQVPRRSLLDNFRLADGTKAEASRHIDAARLRDRALQPASGALRRYSSIVGPNDD
jgi:hypothetical protein